MRETEFCYNLNLVFASYALTYPFDGSTNDVLTILKSDFLPWILTIAGVSSGDIGKLLCLSILELDAVDISVLVQSELESSELDVPVN